MKNQNELFVVEREDGEWIGPHGNGEYSVYSSLSEAEDALDSEADSAEDHKAAYTIVRFIRQDPEETSERARLLAQEWEPVGDSASPSPQEDKSRSILTVKDRAGVTSTDVVSVQSADDREPVPVKDGYSPGQKKAAPSQPQPSAQSSLRHVWAEKCPSCDSPSPEKIYPLGFPRKECHDPWHDGWHSWDIESRQSEAAPSVQPEPRK